MIITVIMFSTLIVYFIPWRYLHFTIPTSLINVCMPSSINDCVLVSLPRPPIFEYLFQCKHAKNMFTQAKYCLCFIWQLVSKYCNQILNYSSTLTNFVEVNGDFEIRLLYCFWYWHVSLNLFLLIESVAKSLFVFRCITARYCQESHISYISFKSNR